MNATTRPRTSRESAALHRADFLPRHARLLTAPRRPQDVDSPGEQAGLRVGDVIVACDGHWMTASGVVSHVQAAQAVTFTVLRNWTVTL